MLEKRANKEVKIASENKIASDNAIKVSLFNIENDFSGFANVVSCFFPSMRHEMVLRYRAETIAKIGIEAYKLAQNKNIKIDPIPPKIALPLIEKMSLEHEPDMYKRWAKLLIATSVNPNPIHQQYADILSNLDSYCAIFLKNIYVKQRKVQNTEERYDDYIEKSMFNSFYENINKRFSSRFSALGEKEISTSDKLNIYYNPTFTFPLIIYGTEKSVLYHWVLVTEENKDKQINPKDHQSPCLSLPEKDKKMLHLLVKLGLIKFRFLEYDHSKDSEKHYIERYGVLLTEFGYSFIDCLESQIKNEPQHNSEADIS